MQQYVDIEGSGQNMTILTGSSTGGSGIINGAPNSELKHLTVHSIGAGPYSIAVTYSSPTRQTDVTFSMADITAIGTGGTDINIGINISGASVTSMRDVKAIASGGATNWGIYDSKDLEGLTVMENVTATATGGASSVGIWMIAPATMHHVAASGTGAADNYGIRSWHGLISMTDVTTTGSGGNSNYDIMLASWSELTANALTTTSGYFSNDGNCTAKIHDSTISSSSLVNSGSLSIANTRVDGTITSNGQMKCVNLFDGNYNSRSCP
jgi:hypothetical protein